MSSGAILVVVCLITLAWVVGTSAVYTCRGDWSNLRRFLFKWGRGINGAPTAFWALLALGALIRMMFP